MRLLIVLFLIVATILGYEANRHHVPLIVTAIVAFIVGVALALLRWMWRGMRTYGPMPNTRGTQQLRHRRLGSDGDTIIDTRTGRKQ